MENKNIYIERNEIKKRKEKQQKYENCIRRNRSIILLVLTLMVISLINIYSASYYNVGMKSKYLVQHSIYIFTAFVVFYNSYRFDYTKYDSQKVTRTLLLLVCVTFISMSILSKVAPAFVPRINGALGWIRIPGVGGVQPAELFKIVFVIIMSQRLALSEKNRDKDFELLKKNMAIPIIFTIFILGQNDLGTLIHYFAALLFMLFVSKIHGKYIALVSLAGGITGVFAMLFIYMSDLSGAGYKLLRIKSFLIGLITNYYDSDKGYQVRQSLIGIGSGGLLGKGYGNGIQKYSYLPEIHTDFIFASFAEEFGFLGVMVILMLILGLFFLIRSTAIECDDFFGKYLAIGICGVISLQFIINISVATGLLPVFGIPMPFMSFGGSSIVTLFMSLGIVMNINRKNAQEIKATM